MSCLLVSQPQIEPVVFSFILVVVFRANCSREPLAHRSIIVSRCRFLFPVFFHTSPSNSRRETAIGEGAVASNQRIVGNNPVEHLIIYANKSHWMIAGSSPHLMCSCSSDATIRTWDTRTFKQVSLIKAGSSQEIFRFCIGRSSSNLLVGGGNSQILFWDFGEMACK